MLIRLAISNLATIQSLSLEFEPGFTVLTGETGAGKSILIDALRFVLGGKGSPDQVRSGSSLTLVEAVFDISGQPQVAERLAAWNIPFERELTVRRMLQENGRNRALANECTLSQPRLEELGGFLVNIHGQHDNQMLLNPSTHIEFLDAFAGLLPLREQVGEAHARYLHLLRERKALREQAGQREQRREALTVAVEELREAQLAPGEEEALRAEHELLTHAEQLAQHLAAMCEALYEGETPLLAGLSEVDALLAQAAAIDPRLSPQLEQLQPIRYQLDDLYRTLRSHAASLEADPNRLDAVNLRLAQLEKVKRKYGGSVAAALAALDEAERELAALERSEDSLESLERQVGEVAGQLHALSLDLSRQRKAAGARLDRQIVQQLRELGMERAEFETRVLPLPSAASGKTPSITAHGVDAVEFLLSTNPGQELRPLSRIASGGELSRTMLALKTVLAKADPTTTLIFDEVDAGIGGRIAEIVGRKLRALGETHQVLCVTHLPQIAALSREHLLVSKHTEGGQTFTRVASLQEREKVREVARLLSGIDISDRSLASAEEMVIRGREAAL